jgi:GTP cyclohydrolase I
MQGYCYTITLTFIQTDTFVMNTLTLPDIASQPMTLQPTLDWVGMQDIALPLQINGQRLTARADAGVSLDDGSARGIHMSRLYLALETLEQAELTPMLLQSVLREFLCSHDGLSQRAYLDLRGELLLRRPALVSPLNGWKSYPFALRSRMDESGLRLQLQLQIGYSSTCPCSAALARQLIQQAFREEFSGKGISHAAVEQWLGSSQGVPATPHSQRSTAILEWRLRPGSDALLLDSVLESAEQALGTALQTAVKRADEQAFALANGQNLMFCEDAARRLHLALLQLQGIDGFKLCVVHAESLHAHDAVARSSWRWSQSA